MDSNISVTSKQEGKFKSFASDLGRRALKKGHAIILFFAILIILGASIYFLPRIDGFYLFCIDALIMIAMSVLSHLLDKKFLERQLCPCYTGKLKISRDSMGAWGVACPNCQLSASTNYSGISGD